MKIRTGILVNYILIYCFYVLHGASFFMLHETEYYPQIIVIVIAALIAAYRKIPIRKSLFNFPIILLVFLSITAIISGGGIGPNLFLTYCADYFITYLLCNYDGKEGIIRYIKFVNLMAVIGIICFVLYLIIPSQIKSALGSGYSFFGRGTDNFRGMFLYCFRGSETRNASIFYEPGVYQTILVSDLLLVLFFAKEFGISSNFFNKTLVIHFAALITAQSTTGFIGAAAVMLLYLFSKGDPQTRRIRNGAIGLISIALVFIVVDYFSKGEQSLFFTVVIKKFSEIEDSSINHVLSGAARIYVMEYAVKSILRNPLGVGFKQFERNMAGYYGLTTSNALGGNIFFKHLASAGIFTHILVLYEVLGKARKRIPNTIAYIALVFIYLNTTFAQAQMLYPSLLMFSMLPMKTEQDT